MNNAIKRNSFFSKSLEGVLEEKRREIIKEWIDSGRIEICQRTAPVIFKIWKFLIRMVEALDIIVDRALKEDLVKWKAKL